MTILPRCLRAACLSAVLALTAILALSATGTGLAQSQSVEVPAYRQLGADEAMASPGQSGTDYSANGPSLAGLTLLTTIPATAVPRLGYFIQAQCAAGLTVVLDDPAAVLTPTMVVLAGPVSAGGEGGSLSMTGMPHTGRIRIYSSSASCQMAARSW
jgi:hypothetical protein